MRIVEAQWILFLFRGIIMAYILCCTTRMKTKTSLVNSAQIRNNILWFVTKHKLLQLEETNDFMTWGRFIYILDSSNSSSFTFWSSKLASSSRSNWTGSWTGHSNGSWTDKHSSHFSTAKEISYILFHVKTTTNNFWNDAEMLLKSFWTIVICKWWMD